MSPARTIAALAGALMIVGCGDPVKANLIEELGPEDPAVPPGPLHRAGQPCLACHDGSGPAHMAMVMAGTVYQAPMDKTPLVAAKVKFKDAGSHTAAAETNCAGNFFLQQADWTPLLPVHVTVEFGDVVATMQTHVGRDGSCASCHADKDTPVTVVHVYLTADPMTFPPSGCK